MNPITPQYLKECGKYRAALARSDERIARLRSEMERVTQALSRVPAHGETRDRLAAQMAELLAIEAERAEQVVRLERRLTSVEEWLLTLPEQQATILRLRYIEGLSWKGVAGRAHYSIRHCVKIHKAALQRCP